MYAADLVESFEHRAREVLSPAVFAYVAGGAHEQITTTESRGSWEGSRFLPRVLRDVTEVSVGATALGHALSSPVAIAPTTLQRAVHPEGERAMAEAAASCGALLVVSSNAGTTFEDIGATGAHWWLQMYLTANRSLSRGIVDRAVGSGAAGIVLTVDTPVVARKPETSHAVWSEIDPGHLRVNFAPGYADQPGHEKATDLGPQDIAWLADATGLPVVVKGVLRAEDASRCRDAGASAIWVSNHGGRQLDRVAPTAAALPRVVQSLGPESLLPVYVDGGIRSAGDVLAAGVTGADLTFIGRAALFALAAGGASAVVELLEAFRADLSEMVRLLGVTSWGSLTPDLLLSPQGMSAPEE